MPRPRKPARLHFDVDRQVWSIRDGDFKRRLDHGFAHRGAAETELAQFLIERDRREAESQRIVPDADDDSNSDPRLVEVATVLGFYAQAKEGTVNAGLTGIHVAHLIRFWGGKRLIHVKGQTCRDYVVFRGGEGHQSKGSKKRKPVSPATARRELETLSAAIGLWHGEYTLTARPKVTLPEKSQPHPDWLTETEYARLLRTIRGERWVASDLTTREQVWERSDSGLPHLERFSEIGYATGTRSAAILGLGWDKALVNGFVDFGSTTLFRAGPLEPKTRKRQPPCRIPDSLLPKLSAWRDADRIERAKAENAGETIADRIVRYRGAEIDRIDQAFGEAARAACLDRREIDGALRVGNPDPADDLGWPTPHILRHTRATLLLRAGVSPHEVGEFLGMSVKMVLDVYGHVHSEYQKTAASIA